MELIHHPSTKMRPVIWMNEKGNNISELEVL